MSAGQKIAIDNGKLFVPANPVIPFIEGDGTGRDMFLAAILPTEARAELTATAKDLDERQTDLKARQKDRETRLATEMARKLTDKFLEELEPEFKEQEEALKELRDIIAGLKHKLSENAAAKERIKEKQTAIEAQKKECRRWPARIDLLGRRQEIPQFCPGADLRNDDWSRQPAIAENDRPLLAGPGRRSAPGAQRGRQLSGWGDSVHEGPFRRGELYRRRRRKG